MKGAADAAHGTTDGTLRGAESNMARVEVMRAGTSRFAEAGLKGQAVGQVDMTRQRAEAGMGLAGANSGGLGASGAGSDVNLGRVASGCSTLERSGW